MCSCFPTVTVQDVDAYRQVMKITAGRTGDRLAVIVWFGA
jgi:hypothetical protein